MNTVHNFLTEFGFGSDLHWIRLFLVIGWFLVLFAVASYARQLGFSSEVTRKTVHIGGGCTSMAFPWLFSTIAEPIILALGLALLLVITRILGYLRCVHDIGRPTHGAILFPLAVVLTCAYGAHFDSPIAATASLGVLSISDAVAALVGKAYGKHTYAIHEGQKSLEGSLAFFVTCIFVIGTALEMSPVASGAAAWLIAVYASLLLTVIEMMAWRGWDNLLLPLATVYLLHQLTNTSLHFLSLQIVFLVGCLLFPVVWFRASGINFAVAIGLGILTYLTVLTTDWKWGAPLLIFMVLYRYSPALYKATDRLKVTSLIWLTAPFIGWIFIANRSEPEAYELSFGAFLVACGVLLTLGLRDEPESFPGTASRARSLQVALTIGLVLSSLILWDSKAPLIDISWSALIVSANIAAWKFKEYLHTFRGDRDKVSSWLPRSSIAALCFSGVGFALIYSLTVFSHSSKA